MPHATTEMTSNGETTSFKALDHVASYPIVNDTVEAVKSHPVGKKSIEIADGAYQRFGKPVEPYLRTPYSYAKPYVTKADELAASGLQQIDERVPVLKEDTHTVIETTKSYAFWPYNYYMSTYSETYQHIAKDSGSENAFTHIKTLWSTNWHVLSDCLQYISDIARPRYEQTKKKGSDYVRQAQETAEHYKQVGQDKVNEYTKLGQQKAGEFQGQAQETAEQAKGQAEKTKEQAKGQAKEVEREAKSKSGSK